MGLEIAAHFTHLADQRMPLNLLGFAAFAGAKACLLRQFGESKESHLLEPGLARRAGGAAINTGRMHRINKRAVHFLVTILNRLPVLL
jgi:hypothetical protein